MIRFKILKESKKSRARLGLIETPHGVIETPTLVNVATQASVKTLTSKEAIDAGSQVLISNTFHLHLKPGESYIKKGGGLHKFMNWPRPLMTDSGGFQVFSFGFGKDLGVGKIHKYFPGKEKKNLIGKGAKPQSIKITEEGVHFRSPVDGSKLFLGPKESINIQENLGADIMFTFDECTAPMSSQEYVREAVRRTHQWAKICANVKKSDNALYGIIQGSIFKDLRLECSKFINSLNFDGFGIGGDLGRNKEELKKIIQWSISKLATAKPRHLLGIGYLEDMEPIIKEGIDTFDCIVPTHYARHGTAFTSEGKLNLEQTKFLKDKNPLDKKCACWVCTDYKRNYIAHLIRANEITALRMLTFHNLHYFNNFAASIREKIKNGKI